VHEGSCSQRSADEVISTEDEDLVERVAAITGITGVYAALDAVGGDMLEQARASVPRRAVAMLLCTAL
jgi:NADPH:quinone reductase-like Zn-dependent oxidoreductase